MIDIFVQRGDGEFRGDDVEEPLISEMAVALEYGRTLLDKYSPKKPVTLSVNYRAGIRAGQLLESHDSLQGVSWRGKITGVKYSYSDLAAGVDTELTVERVE